MKYITINHTWTETVQEDGELVERERTVQLTVGGEANLRMGMRRSLLIEQQSMVWKMMKELRATGPDATDSERLEATAEEILRVAMYPSLIAAVTAQVGFPEWPVSYEWWANEMPEELGIKWEEAVFELNPHWVPKVPQSIEEERKKAMTGTSELLTG